MASSSARPPWGCINAWSPAEKVDTVSTQASQGGRSSSGGQSQAPICGGDGPSGQLGRRQRPQCLQSGRWQEGGRAQPPPAQPGLTTWPSQARPFNTSPPRLLAAAARCGQASRPPQSFRSWERGPEVLAACPPTTAGLGALGVEPGRRWRPGPGAPPCVPLPRPGPGQPSRSSGMCPDPGCGVAGRPRSSLPAVSCPQHSSPLAGVAGEGASLACQQLKARWCGATARPGKSHQGLERPRQPAQPPHPTLLPSSSAHSTMPRARPMDRTAPTGPLLASTWERPGNTGQPCLVGAWQQVPLPSSRDGGIPAHLRPTREPWAPHDAHYLAATPQGLKHSGRGTWRQSEAAPAAPRQPDKHPAHREASRACPPPPVQMRLGPWGLSNLPKVTGANQEQSPASDFATQDDPRVSSPQGQDGVPGGPLLPQSDGPLTASPWGLGHTRRSLTSADSLAALQVGLLASSPPGGLTAPRNAWQEATPTLTLLRPPVTCLHEGLRPLPLLALARMASGHWKDQDERHASPRSQAGAERRGSARAKPGAEALTTGTSRSRQQTGEQGSQTLKGHRRPGQGQKQVRRASMLAAGETVSGSREGPPSHVAGDAGGPRKPAHRGFGGQAHRTCPGATPPGGSGGQTRRCRRHGLPCSPQRTCDPVSPGVEAHRGASRTALRPAAWPRHPGTRHGQHRGVGEQTEAGTAQHLEQTGLTAGPAPPAAHLEAQSGQPQGLGTEAAEEQGGLQGHRCRLPKALISVHVHGMQAVESAPTLPTASGRRLTHRSSRAPGPGPHRQPGGREEDTRWGGAQGSSHSGQDCPGPPGPLPRDDPVRPHTASTSRRTHQL
ncbi:collagen alpha-1(III) chain-like [Odocoileus virginianus]|uniref:Collagen alpha-1(III) chain-like n=1 Tax=Odocoileus virginianus TaxID=9874 RepID=A0ABM4ISH6_ODOVR